MDNRELTSVIVKRGWSVFPCGDNKKPFIKNGYKGATTNKAVIAKWFEQYPNFKIGIPCVPNFFFAADIDPDGLDTWAEWTTDNKVCLGPRQQTPRGGMHFLFKLPVGIKIINNAGKVSEGIDFRSDGYICTDSIGYKWGGGDCGIGAPLFDAPEWLLVKIREYNERKEQASSNFSKQEHNYEPSTNQDEIARYWLDKALSAAHQGNRNQTGFELACQLRDSQLSKGKANFYVREYVKGVPKGTDPYLLKEAVTSLKEAYNSPPREPAQFKAKANAVIPAPASNPVVIDPSEVYDIPVGVILRSEQLAKLDLIASGRQIQRHLLLSEIIGSFLRNLDDNKNT